MVTMGYSIIALLTLSISAGSSQAFLLSGTPVRAVSKTSRSATGSYALLRRESPARALCVLSMADENNGEGATTESSTPDVNALLEAARETEAASRAEKESKAEERAERAAEAAAAATVAAASAGPAGPALQPAEDRKREEEEMRAAKPPEENKWASGAFKRGVALQVCKMWTPCFGNANCVFLHPSEHQYPIATKTDRCI